MSELSLKSWFEMVESCEVYLLGPLNSVILLMSISSGAHAMKQK